MGWWLYIQPSVPGIVSSVGPILQCIIMSQWSDVTRILY